MFIVSFKYQDIELEAIMISASLSKLIDNN